MDDTLRFVLIAVGVAGVFTGGFMTGSIFAHRKLEAEMDERLDEALKAETEKIKSHYAAVHKTDYPTPGDLVAATAEKRDDAAVPEEIQTQLANYAGVPLVERGPQLGVQYLNINPTKVEEEEPEQELVTRTVFNNMIIESDSWDPDVNHPHVISVEDFEQNDNGWEQETLTWYAGDNTLADASDVPVDNMSQTVGDPRNLELFGFISKDKNVVHIRNPQIETDYEILRSSGSYAREVAGFTGEDD